MLHGISKLADPIPGLRKFAASNSSVKLAYNAVHPLIGAGIGALGGGLVGHYFSPEEKRRRNMWLGMGAGAGLGALGGHALGNMPDADAAGLPKVPVGPAAKTISNASTVANALPSEQRTQRTPGTQDSGGSNYTWDPATGILTNSDADKINSVDRAALMTEAARELNTENQHPAWFGLLPTSRATPSSGNKQSIRAMYDELNAAQDFNSYWDYKDWLQNNTYTSPTDAHATNSNRGMLTLAAPYLAEQATSVMPQSFKSMFMNRLGRTVGGNALQKTVGATKFLGKRAIPGVGWGLLGADGAGLLTDYWASNTFAKDPLEYAKQHWAPERTTGQYWGSADTSDTVRTWVKQQAPEIQKEIQKAYDQRSNKSFLDKVKDFSNWMYENQRKAGYTYGPTYRNSYY